MDALPPLCMIYRPWEQRVPLPQYVALSGIHGRNECRVLVGVDGLEE